MLMLFFGFSIIEAIATNFISWIFFSAVSLTVFTMHGLVNFPYGIALLFGMMLGSSLGAHLAIRNGDQWIKPLFAAAVMAIKLLFF